MVVYGSPTTTSQLIRCECSYHRNSSSDIIVFGKQLFGRAGRGGMPSLAHLFYSSKKSFRDKDMEQFAKTEGCRRKVLLNSIGGSGGRECHYRMP